MGSRHVTGGFTTSYFIEGKTDNVQNVGKNNNMVLPTFQRFPQSIFLKGSFEM